MARFPSCSGVARRFLAAGCAVCLAAGDGVLLAQESKPAETPPAPAAAEAPAAEAAAKLPPEQLESLIAPIALYPDPLLAQVLVASTYPLEIVQLHQWLQKHPELKDKELADAVAKEPWDASIQSMAATPDVVKRLAEDIQWTTDLGNAFLAQQGDVMDAAQRMRKKAKDKGALESNEQMKVETKVVEEKEVIVIESSNPEVIYVPSYSPTVVYGAPVYPYPPIYYPPYPAGGMFISFSVGMMWGAAWGGSCCGCGWGGNDIDINVDNNFNNIQGGGNRGQGGGNWQHNPQHRGGTPYGDRATASKYGGAARGDARPSAGQQGPRQGAAGGRGGAGPSTADRSMGGRSGASPSSRPSTGGAGGSDRIGSRNIPQSSSARSGGGFSGGSRGYSGSSARAGSSRGASSMGGARGGGGGGRRR